MKSQTMCDAGKMRRNRHRRFTGTCLLVTAAFILFLTGCATTKSIFERYRGKGDALTKKVMVLPLMDVGGLGERLTAQTQREFYEWLGRAPRLSLHFQGSEENAGDPTLTAVEYGIITNPEMIRKARAQGMNAVVAGALNPVQVTHRKNRDLAFPQKGGRLSSLHGGERGRRQQRISLPDQPGERRSQFPARR